MRRGGLPVLTRRAMRIMRIGRSGLTGDGPDRVAPEGACSSRLPGTAEDIRPMCVVLGLSMIFPLLWGKSPRAFAERCCCRPIAPARKRTPSARGNADSVNKLRRPERRRQINRLEPIPRGKAAQAPSLAYAAICVRGKAKIGFSPALAHRAESPLT